MKLYYKVEMNVVRRKLNEFIRSKEKSFAPLNYIEISSDAILHNFDYFHELLKIDLMLVLKSNAYGHGLLNIAQILKKRKFSYLVVDGYFEALKIREISTQPILIMGYIDPINFKKLDYDNFSFVVQDMDTLYELSKLKRKCKIHLEINTGMNRYGIDPIDSIKFITKLQSNKHIMLEGIMSHLADADNGINDYTDRQVKIFDKTVEEILKYNFNPRFIHISQTAGSTKANSKYANSMRLGIGLYGINPLKKSDRKFKSLVSLKPALELKSKITKIISLKSGEKVSYNGIYTATDNTKIGVLPLGYYEGLNRALSNNGIVKIRNKYYPIAGRVCMNHTMIDLGKSEVVKNDIVTVISSNPRDKNSIINLQNEFGLFAYETLVKLNENIRRINIS